MRLHSDRWRWPVGGSGWAQAGDGQEQAHVGLLGGGLLYHEPICSWGRRITSEMWLNTSLSRRYLSMYDARRGDTTRQREPRWRTGPHLLPGSSAPSLFYPFSHPRRSPVRESCIKSTSPAFGSRKRQPKTKKPTNKNTNNTNDDKNNNNGSVFGWLSHHSLHCVCLLRHGAPWSGRLRNCISHDIGARPGRNATNMTMADTDGRFGHAIPSTAEFQLALVFMGPNHKPHGIQARHCMLALRGSEYARRAFRC